MSELAEQIAYYKAWKAHRAEPRPLLDEHDPYRCPTCNAQMLRNPWRCPTHGETKPTYAPRNNNDLARRIEAEAQEWPDPDWEALVDGLLAHQAVAD